MVSRKKGEKGTPDGKELIRSLQDYPWKFIKCNLLKGFYGRFKEDPWQSIMPFQKAGQHVRETIIPLLYKPLTTVLF